MNPEVARLARMLEKTFDKSPWYGPSVMSIVGEITAELAGLRAGQSHSIIELVLHMASWRNFASRRLMGDHDFQVTDAANFPAPTGWKAALQKLHESQTELLAAVKAFPDEKLGDLVPHSSHRYTYYTLLHGIIQHDIYHLGQIQLIRKSSASS